MATLTSRLAVGYRNLAAGATVTASSAAASWPSANLADPRISAPWIGADGVLSGVTLTLDHGASVDRDVAALVATNLSDAATVRYQVSTVSDFATTVYDSGTVSAFDLSLALLLGDALPGGRPVVHFPGSTQSGRYERWTLTDAGNPDNRLQAGVAWSGPVWQPAKNWSIDGSGFAGGLEGEPGVERLLRRFRPELEMIQPADKVAVDNLVAVLLRSGRQLVVPRPLEPAGWLWEAPVLYAQLAGAVDWVEAPTAAPSWSGSLEWREVED